MMLEIDGWKVGIKFSASHFIPGHTKCSRLHGHDYAIRVRIYGEPRECILYDFVELKKKLRSIAESLDHRLILPRSQDYIKHTVDGGTIRVEFSNKTYSFPREDVVFIDCKMTSAEELAKYISSCILAEINFPDNVKGIEICVDEGPGQGACHYTSVGD